MKFFPVFLLLYGMLLIIACQPVPSGDDLPIITASENVLPTHTPAPTEPLATATPLSSPLLDEETPVATEVTATADAFLPMRGDSFSPVVSADGRYVVFTSRAGDLIEGDTNQCHGPNDTVYNCADVFLFDRQSGRFRLISVAPNGQPANGNSFSPAISADGHWIAFVSEATNLTEKPIDFQGLFLVDGQNGGLELIAAAGRDPSISADGRFVTYSGDLSPPNVYLYDHETGRSDLVSRGWDGQAADGDSIGPQISADGRWIAFWSWAGNLMPEDGEVCRQNEDVNYSCGDVYIFDRETGQIARIPVGEGYGLGMGTYVLSLSAGGNRIAFNCQIYERDTAQVIYSERCGQISGDGQVVAWQQGADFFVQELATGSVVQVSVAGGGTPGNGELINFENAFEGKRFDPGFDISTNARWVVFASTASNLDPDDTHICHDSFFAPHNCYDIYIHDRETGLTEWISKPDDINRE